VTLESISIGAPSGASWSSSMTDPSHAPSLKYCCVVGRNANCSIRRASVLAALIGLDVTWLSGFRIDTKPSLSAMVRNVAGVNPLM
jgi:hypothetical protein